MNWDPCEEAERQAEKLEQEEFKRQREFGEEFVRTAKPGSLYTFKFSVMDPLATELRRDFEDYTDRFQADPMLAMVYLGKNKRRWKKGPWSLQFIATNPHGDTAVVWMDEYMLGNICEFKKK